MSEEPSLPQEVDPGGEVLTLIADFPRLDPAALFEHWVEPSRLRLWWAPEADVEPQVGGAYLLAWPAMDWLLRGRIARYEPGEAFGFTWSRDHEPERPTTQVLVLIDQGGRITLTHGPYPDGAEGQEMRQEHLEGWTYFLPRLGEVSPYAAPSAACSSA